MNIPVELLGQVDAYAKKMNVNRTSAVCVLLSQSLDAQMALTTLAELTKAVQIEQAKKTIEE